MKYLNTFFYILQRLTSGVDSLIQTKKDDLAELKKESYYQQKKTGVQLEEEEKEEEKKGKKKKKDKKKKKWVDLDTAEFSDQDGIVTGDEDNESTSASEGPDIVDDVDKAEDKEDKEEDKKDSEKEDSIGLVEIPDDPIDWEADEDIFNTAAAEVILSGDIKLAIIPDDPVYDDDEDPFSTKIADEIAKFDREKKRKEASKLKFTGLSSVADVLSGKKDKVDKDLVEVTTKSKRRRANRINLIAEEQSDVTKQEDISTIVKKDPADEQCDFLTTAENGLGVVPVGDLLSATPSPLPTTPSDPTTTQKTKSKDKTSSNILDLHDFEELETKNASEQLTSNVAILAGEFTKAAEEEVDEFDAAFDALAQDSFTKYKLDELEKEWEDEDVFDTTNADKILNLVSLANKVEVEEEPLETWDDKDPFDTSAYDDITGDLEADLGFECLAKRDPEEERPIINISAAEIDPFLDLSKGSDAFGGIPGITVAKVPDEGWAAFKSDKKPTRPPPPKPAPPRPPRPPLRESNSLNPSEKSSVSVVVKAPSTESIKSWNCAVADKLITKSKLEALENSILSEDEEDEEDDPFDTSNFRDVGEFEETKEEVEDPFDTSAFGGEETKEEVEDPFDTSAFRDFEEEEEVPDFEEAQKLLKEQEKIKENKPEAQVDLLSDIEIDKDLDTTLVPVAKNVDPFDTDFASDILPNKGDPFDTSFVKGGPGKAEIRALEDEFLEKENFDPRTAEGTSIPRKPLAPGIAGRQRPSAALSGLSELEIKAPPIEKKKVESEEEIVDPFDTTIVNKVVPIRKAKKSSEISVEDQDFDPTSTFKAVEIEEIDPFDTSAATEVIPELKAQAEAEAKAKAEEELRKAKEVAEAESKAKERAIAEAAAKLAKIDENKPLSSEPIAKPLPHSLTDDDFDPRA